MQHHHGDSWIPGASLPSISQITSHHRAQPLETSRE